MIDDMTAGGGTDLSSGLSAAVAVLRNRPETASATTAAILFFTDGQGGEPTAEQVRDACNTRCVLHCFGIGSDHDVGTMRKMASDGNGEYIHIANSESIGTSLALCLATLLTVCANDVSVECTDSKAVYRVGAMFCDEQRNIVFETPAASPTLTLTWTHPTTSERLSASCVANSTGPNLTVDMHRNRIIAATAMEFAASRGILEDLAGAQLACEQAIVQLAGSASADLPDVTSLIRDLQECRDRCTSRDTFIYGGGLAWASQRSISHFQQRSYSNDMPNYLLPAQLSQQSSEAAYSEHHTITEEPGAEPPPLPPPPGLTRQLTSTDGDLLNRPSW